MKKFFKSFSVYLVVVMILSFSIFVTASAEERADRRYKELKEKGMDVNYQDIYDDIVQRDYNDSHREIAPLKPAEDSVVLDTTGVSLEDQIASIINIIKEKIQ